MTSGHLPFPIPYRTPLISAGTVNFELMFGLNFINTQYKKNQNVLVNNIPINIPKL